MKPFVRRSLVAAALLAAMAGVSATAIAQNMPPQGTPQPPRMEQMHQRHAEHQTQLKAALKLTASQEAAWNAFAKATEPNPNLHPPLSREDWAKLTTPQRMEKMQALRAERDARMAKRMDAVKTFYAVLTPEQQKAFDGHFFGGFAGPRMHGGPDGHHGMGPMEGHGCDAPPPPRKG